MDIGYCPEMSRDANGSAEITDRKVFSNVAGSASFIPTLYSAKTQRMGEFNFELGSFSSIGLGEGFFYLPT